MRKIKLYSGQYYHLYNRGVNRQQIFFNDDNKYFFLKQLRKYAIPDLIDIIAYCLMPNHYHLLIYLKTDALSNKIMQPFGVSYTKAVNKQQGRVGPLFQGPFKAKLVDKEGYLIGLSCYIHMNPVVAGYVTHPEKWVFSSYRDYIGLRECTLLNPDIIMSQFPSKKAYTEWVELYIEDKKEINEGMLLD